MSTRLSTIYLLLLFVLSLAITAAYGQDYWLVGDGNWSNGGNWSMGVPLPSSNAVINSGYFNYTVTLNTNPSIDSLILGGNSAQLTDAGVTRNLSIANGLTTSPFGSLDLYGVRSTLSVGGAFYDYGGISLSSSGDRANVGQLYLSQASNVYIAPDATLNLTNQPGGITDAPSGSSLGIFGSFNDVVGGGSGLANLTGVEGSVLLLNGHTTTIDPVGGSLSLNGTYNCPSSGMGCLHIGNGSTVKIIGDVNNYSGGLTTGSLGTGRNNLTITGNLYNDNSGIVEIEGSGDVVNVGTVNNYGNFYIYPGNAVSNVAGDLNNSGIFQDYGHANITGSLNNTGNFLIDGPGVSVSAGTLSNTGLLTILRGAALSLTGQRAIGTDVSHNLSTYALSGGSIVVDGVFSSGAGIQVTGGTLSGSGQIQGDVFMGGTISPGDSLGTLIIQGNYTQLAGGTFTEEIAGISPGTLYDQLIVNGAVSLDGTLTGSLLNGFVPDLGSIYKFLFFTPGELTGTFATVTGYWSAIYDNAGGYVALESTPEPASFLLLGSGLLTAAFGIRGKLM